MENEESCVNLSTVLSPETALKTALAINKGRIQCRICFTETLERNIKRAGIQKIKDNTSLKEKVQYEYGEYEYGAIYEHIDWPNLEEDWADKSCKIRFLRKLI